jgi:hypothetical protein
LTCTKKDYNTEINMQSCEFNPLCQIRYNDETMQRLFFKCPSVKKVIIEIEEIFNRYVGYLRMILYKISTAISIKHRILATFNIRKKSILTAYMPLKYYFIIRWQRSGFTHPCVTRVADYARVCTTWLRLFRMNRTNNFDQSL